jgi:hypothetical protein
VNAYLNLIQCQETNPTSPIAILPGRSSGSDKQALKPESVLSALLTAVMLNESPKTLAKRRYPLFNCQFSRFNSLQPTGLPMADPAAIFSVFFLNLGWSWHLHLGQPRSTADGVLNLKALGRVLAQHLLGILPTLRQPLSLVGEERAPLLDQI